MSKVILSVLFLFLIAIASVSPARAQSGLHQPTTYFVSPEGQDTGDGSAANPWHTLQHAANQAMPGDTIVVRKGDYAGFVLGWDQPQGGREDLPISYLADPGATIVSRNGKTKDGIDLEGHCSYTIFKGFHINNASGSISRAGIRITESNHVQVLNNICDGCGSWGIFTSHSSDLVIENNVACHSGKEHGIYVSNSAARVVVRGNRCYSNAKCGIHMNGDASQGGNGLITDALVEDNIIYDNGRHGGSAINCDGLQHSIIRCNLLYNNHASGISLFRDDGADGSKGNRVANNTIVMAADGRWALNIQGGSVDNVAVNNILFDANPSRGSITVSSDSLSGFFSDHNIVEDRFSTDDSEESLAQWQQSSGQDQHSQASTPEVVFANADAGDFHLADKSPAIHAGAAGVATQGGPSKDLDGHAWDNSPDIGAYHFRQ